LEYKQSKKQNQQITRASEKSLVVGADITEETHVALGRSTFGELNCGKTVCSPIPVMD
jgi:hypothetical protein